MENSDHTFANNRPVEKERHGCVTAWLIYLILMNSLRILGNLFWDTFKNEIADNFPFNLNISVATANTLILVHFIKIVLILLLFRWKKWAFWAFVVMEFVIIGFNINSGLPVGSSIFNLFGILILWAMLQIKKDDVSAWDNME